MNFDIKRFIKAQESEYSGYEQALAEIKAGQKVSHWIWYIFPQLKGLGVSYNAVYYGIYGKAEAEAYIAEPILNSRLREICTELLKHRGSNIVHILGSIDALKLKSSMTLFDTICPDDVFAEVLKVFYNGNRDEHTLKLLK
jgi:uncharacterized protein (DUF1810 family)